MTGRRIAVVGGGVSGITAGYVLARTEDRVQVRIQDYRDPLDGPYDAIASVEMGEHVGAARYQAFCAALYGRLRPGGRLLIQQMSRTTRRGGGPFIESYIAPDMDMRPVGETIRLIQDAGFEVKVRSLRIGNVILQSPGAGSQRRQGTAVTIWGL